MRYGLNFFVCSFIKSGLYLDTILMGLTSTWCSIVVTSTNRNMYTIIHCSSKCWQLFSYSNPTRLCQLLVCNLQSYEKFTFLYYLYYFRVHSEVKWFYLILRMGLLSMLHYHRKHGDQSVISMFTISNI